MAVQKRILFSRHSDGEVFENEAINYLDYGDTVLILQYKEGERRAQVLCQYGVGYCRCGTYALREV